MLESKLSRTVFCKSTMKFTFDWLKDHLKTDLTYDEIAERLTNLGIEVDEVIDNNKKFENFVVGYIESAEKHPNADKLQVCRVNVGDQALQIVCGAKNARPGIYVVVALVGAMVPAFNEKLKKGVIRGIESCGMMCSTDELLLEDDGIDGIMELNGSGVLKPGQDFASALGINDVVFDVSITPNRADCFSVRGIARDLAASGAGELLDLDFAGELSHGEIENPISVKIDTEKCSYFSTLALTNVSGKTPDYIARRLKAVGQNLLYMPVDIANYVCLDIGQPLHMFDLERLPGELVVRDSRQGEVIKTLDGKDTVLPDGAIVVSSKDPDLAPFSIAGIMGGESSAISGNSTSVFIESAYFDKIAISRAGQILRLNTDARTRFERGVDPEVTDIAIRYVASLIRKASGANCQISEVRKWGNLPSNKNTINLTFQKFNALTGFDIETFNASRSNLEKLGMKIISQDSNGMTIDTPSWRHDLEIEEDIIEEILRLIGYDNVEETELPIQDRVKIKTYTDDRISDALVFNGYFEVKTFSFTGRKLAETFANHHKLINIKDALNSDFSTLRPSIIASHMKSIKNSQNKAQRNSKIFEIGKCFYQEDHRIIERKCLVATISEKRNPANWRFDHQEDVSIFDIKEDLERILHMLGISFRLVNGAPAYYHPGRSGTYIFQKDTEIAYFGEVHPTIVSEMGLNGPIVCFELYLDNLPEFIENGRAKKPLAMSQYQPTTRDFSFIVKKSVPSWDIVNAVYKQRIQEIRDISIFDVYESENIGFDNKAVAIEVMLQSDKETLSDERISNISQSIVDAVSKNCSGILRDK